MVEFAQYEDPNALASVDPMASQAPPAPVAPPTVRVGQELPPEQAPAGWRTPQEQQDLTDSAVLGKLALGEPITQEEANLLSPGARERAAAEIRKQRIMAPEFVPGSPGQPEAWIPTTTSESYEGPANMPEIRGAFDDVGASAALALAASQDIRQARLENEYQLAQKSRQRLQEQVNRRETELVEIERAADRARQKAFGMRQAVRDKTIDSARIFRNNPMVAVAATMADVAFALGGGQPQNTLGQLIQNDVALQLEEINKLGLDAQNALSDVAIQFDGDLEQAAAALQNMQAEALKAYAAEQAAAYGLQELPAVMLAEFADLDNTLAKNELAIGQTAKRKASEAQQYQPYKPATSGYRKPPSLSTQVERAKQLDELTELEQKASTGLTQAQRFELQKTEAERAAAGETVDPQLVKEYGIKRGDLEKSRKGLDDLTKDFEGQIAELGSVPGLRLGERSFVGKGWAQFRNQLGSERAEAFLDNQRKMQKVLLDAQAAIKGIPSDRDVQILIDAVRGSGTLDEQLNALRELRTAMDDTVDAWGGAFGPSVVRQYERNRGAVLESKPKVPQPRGTAKGEFTERQQELLGKVR